MFNLLKIKHLFNFLGFSCLLFFGSILVFFNWGIIMFKKPHRFKYMIWWIVTNVYSLVSTIIMGIWNISFTPQSPPTLSESVLSLQPCHWFLSLYSLLHLEFHINGIIQVCSVLYLVLSFTWHTAFEIYSSCCAHH